MIINYNVSGSDRKQLVAAIAEHTGEKAKYLGAPGFAYQIGGFTVSVDGKVTIEDNSTAAPLIHFLREKGFQAEDPLADCIADDADEEVEAAAKAAFADHFIRTLPGGYDMEINEDASNISQGQRQLLTIARAILADRRMLILDEATSSVDTRTEERIRMAMDNLMEGRTSFVIAHRLSTIRNADLILVLREGDIVEQGTHDELLVKGGAYAELYNSQFAE